MSLSCLAQQKCVSASDVDTFCKDIICYIDSRDKSLDTADATLEADSSAGNKIVGVLDAGGNNACAGRLDVDSDDTADDDDDDDESCDSDDSFQPEETAVRAPQQDQACKKKNKKKKMALWPLINAVRIRTKAPILSTGLVLVDLVSEVRPSTRSRMYVLIFICQPGVADSNAARDAVATQYLKKCDAI